MLESAASAHLDWVWIEFVGLWLLGPLVAVVGLASLLHHWRGRRHK